MKWLRLSWKKNVPYTDHNFKVQKTREFHHYILSLILKQRVQYIENIYCFFVCRIYSPIQICFIKINIEYRKINKVSSHFNIFVHPQPLWFAPDCHLNIKIIKMSRNGTITFNAVHARIRANISASGNHTWLVELIFIGALWRFSNLSWIADRYYEVTKFPRK